jgi:hypothetical protein
MPKFNSKKWSFAEMTSNTNGKTSGSGTAGVFTIAVGLIGFALGVYDYIWGTHTNTVMTQSIFVIVIGAGLLGYRKSIKTTDMSLTDIAGVDDSLLEKPKDTYTTTTKTETVAGDGSQLPIS